MHEKHGRTKHPIYTTWRAMRSRCYSSADEHWPDYGGRGIKVCAEWDSFPTFFAWSMANGWAPGLTIDRAPDVNGDYTPANCRWTDAKGQAQFKRPQKMPSNAVVVEHAGRRMNLRQWAADSGIGYTTLMKRIQRGITGAALFAPVSAVKSHPQKQG